MKRLAMGRLCLLIASALISVSVAAIPLRGALQDSPARHHAAAMEHWQAGRTDEALAEFRQALRLDRNYLPSLVEMADLLSSNERVFEAYGVLRHAVTVAPKSADVHALLGRCFSRLKKLKEAREEMRRALELNPELNEPHYGLAVVDRELGRLAEARRHIEAFLERAPETEGARELRARLSFEMKDYEAALAAYQDLRKSKPDRADLQAQVARTLLAAKRYAEAEQAYRALLKQAPSSASALALQAPGDESAARGWFEASYQRGNYPQAVEAMEQLARLKPKSCEPLLDLLRAYRRLNQFAQARQQAQRCLDLDPAHAYARFLLGWLWFGEGEMLRAKTALAEAVKLDPNSAEAQYWLGMVELRLGENNLALRHLEKATALDPAHAGARYALALEYARQNRPAEARKQGEEFRRLKAREEWKSESAEGSPAMPRAAPGSSVEVASLADWTGFAEYLIREKKPREALEILERARQIAPQSAEVALLTAFAYAEVGEVEPALAAYAEAEKRGPTGPLFLGRGQLYFRLEEDDLALADLRRAAAMELPVSRAAEAHLLFASVLAKKKQWGEAESELRRALALDPNSSAARVLLAWALLELRKPAESAKECRRALEQSPGEVSAHLLLARALLAESRAAEAGAAIKQAAALEGETGRVLLARGRLAAAQNLPDAATSELNRAVQADPSQAEAFYLLGTELLKLQRSSEAAVSFEKATIVDPAGAGSWLELGKIYLNANRFEAAIGYLRNAVNAAPDNAESHYQLAVALSKTAQPEQALQEARRAQALGHREAKTLLESLVGSTPR